MKFKIGHKVRLKYGKSTCSTRHSGPYVRTIKEVFNNHCILNCCENGAWNEELELILKKEITNDVDWLNAVQDNFKEGI